MALSSSSQRWLLLSFIVSLVACGLVGIYTLLLGSFGWFELRILATTATIGGASILAMAAAAAWEARRWPPLAVAGMIAPAVACVLMLGFIWELTPSTVGDLVERWIGTAVVAAVALPHMALLGLARLHRRYELVRIATIVVIGKLAAILVLTIWARPFDGDFFWRLVGVLAILDACGTVAVPILHRVSRIQSREGVVTTALSVSLTCPRCGRGQTVSTGASRCACGLRIRIEIEEEHCATCGYSLYRLTSDACPECGTPIAAAKR